METQDLANVDGLMLKEDAFGEQMLVDFDDSVYEPVTEEQPEKIDWTTNGLFQGTYQGTKVIPLEDNESFSIVLLKDRDGNLRSTALDFAWSQAVENLTPGDQIVVQFKGKKSLSGGRTLNEYRILRRK